MHFPACILGLSRFLAMVTSRSPWVFQLVISGLRLFHSAEDLVIVKVLFEPKVKILNKLASARASGRGGGSKVLTDLIEALQEPAFAVELRLKINQNHQDLKGGSFRDYGEAVLKHLENSVSSDPKLQRAPVNYEGVRISGYGGWFLLRLSLHDPVLPLNIEAPSNEDAVKLGLVVVAAVKKFAGLDTSALDKFVGAS